MVTSAPLPASETGGTSDDVTPVWLALRPHDAIQVRDGRSFTAGAGGAARTQRPWPSTVAGALGAAFKAAAPNASPAPEPRVVRGPFLGRWNSGPRRWDLAFPVPADVVPSDTSPKLWRRLRPQNASVLTDLDQDGLRWLYHSDAGTRDEELWWRRSAMQGYLRGEEIDSDLLSSLTPPVTTEARTGVALQNRAARHAHLYRSDYLRLREDAN
ncbi:MAG TPA: hypothetical protein H9836_16610, partial [Candidatus Nocardiopsis merdipullorum]|nr:hypothetical protein [Candidatus Nocardiopsis merdipullorum]